MLNKKSLLNRIWIVVLAFATLFSLKAQAKDDVITLRVSNWEEYLDLGEWDEEETMELDNGAVIYGERALYEEFEDWYYETYGKRVKVEYSCFGTNEDLYNQLTLGDTYDLVCPSDYMLMKLMVEGKAEPFSDTFYDTENEYNYYAKGVSPYINSIFENHSVGGEAWKNYAACYMWGITGVLYNPEFVDTDEAQTWAIFDNPKYFRRVTLKDNVRDTYFAAMGYMREKELMSETFLNDPNYEQNLYDVMNDVTPETISEIEEVLQHMIGNIYALETDSGKADMVTGKIVANYQWSGDAVYAMDLAEEDDVYLEFAVPQECTNVWFDGWMMLKNGIAGDSDKKHAAEAFVNFLSRPDNAVRNMYYIGYTSAIAGGEDDTVFSYIDYCYGAEEEEEVLPYSIGYFFGADGENEDYWIYTSEDQFSRQLFAQYPDEEVIGRAAIMGYFNEEETKNINQMWINIRCFNIKDIPPFAYAIVSCFILIAAFIAIQKIKKKTFYFDKQGLYVIIIIGLTVLSVFLLFQIALLNGSRVETVNELEGVRLLLDESRLEQEALTGQIEEEKLRADNLEEELQEARLPRPQTVDPYGDVKHKVYLTFDDGPSKNTEKILDILDEYGVKATFFVLGKEDDDSIRRLQDIAERGHSIGMHSYSHEYGEVYASMDAFIEDFHRISDYIYKNTGIQSTLYRFPGGSSNTVSDIRMIEAARYLTGAGVTYVDWNVSSGDAEKKKLTKQKLIENCLNNIDKRETSIILLHDAASKDVTVEALPELIESILAIEDTMILPVTDTTAKIQHIHVE